MKTIISKNKIDYDGSQLKSLWIYDNFGEQGDAIVAFTGKCDVNKQYMVDLDDLKNKDFIYSDNMLHFIVECFGIPLKETVFLQRLLIFTIKERLENKLKRQQIQRFGDDIFIDKGKLTVSIATVSPLSGLIHTGINISSKNTPVKTKGLQDLEIKPRIFAQNVVEHFAKEIEQIKSCLSKVKWVK